MGSIIKVNEYKDFGNNAIMTSDGAGVVTPNADGLKNVPAFEAYNSSVQGSLTSGAATKIQANTERFDTGGCYDNSTNYRFTPTTAGKYFFYVNADIYSESTPTAYMFKAAIYKNGSNFIVSTRNITTTGSNWEQQNTTNVASTIDMNGTTDYLEGYAIVTTNSGTWAINAYGYTFIGAYRIIGA